MASIKRPRLKSAIQSIVPVLFLLFSYEFIFAQHNLFWNISLNRLEKHFVYKSWHVKNGDGEDTQLTQFALPVSLGLYWGNRGSVLIRVTPALSSFSIKEDIDRRFEFDGISDMKFDGSYIIGDQSGLITFGFNLPFDNKGLTENEFIVAKAIAEDAFDFPLSLYSAGYEGNIGIFLAKDFNSVTLGGGISYFRRGQFKLFKEEDASDFDPGDEITASLGLDIDIPHGDISVDTYFTLRQTDTFAGVKVFDPGKKLVLNVSSNIKHPSGLPITLDLWIKNRWRFNSQFLMPPAEFEFSEIIREDLNENPRQIEAGSVINYNLGLQYSLIGLVEFKDFTANNAGNEDARVWGVGIGFRADGLHAGPLELLTPVVTLKYYDGHMNSLGNKFKLSGYQICGTISCSF